MVVLLKVTPAVGTEQYTVGDVSVKLALGSLMVVLPEVEEYGAEGQPLYEAVTVTV
jgi:hypothetical protein